jgi:hypothetical protein
MRPYIPGRLMRVAAMMRADLERQQFLIERSELMLRDAEQRIERSPPPGIFTPA